MQTDVALSAESNKLYYGAYGQFLAVDALIPEWVVALEIPLFYNYNFHFITFPFYYQRTDAFLFYQVFSVPYPCKHMYFLLCNTMLQCKGGIMCNM